MEYIQTIQNRVGEMELPQIREVLRSTLFWTSAGTVATFVVLRRWFSGGVCTSKASMVGKTVIVTGANSGIGRATVEDLARRGARVIMACRNTVAAEKVAAEIRKKTGNNKIVVKKLDLASLESVRKFAEEVIAEERRLDVLINNAGVLVFNREETVDGFEKTFATNHLGHFLLTNLLLDLITASAPSRIVNVSSAAYKTPFAFPFDDLMTKKDYACDKAYAVSKQANIYFSTELAKRLRGTGVVSNALHPGAIPTNIANEAIKKSWRWRAAFFVIGSLSWLFFKSPSQGAQTTIYLAVSEEAEHVTGKYFADCKEDKLRPHMKVDEVGPKLWDVSEKLVGLAS